MKSRHKPYRHARLVLEDTSENSGFGKVRFQTVEVVLHTGMAGYAQFLTSTIEIIKNRQASL